MKTFLLIWLVCFLILAALDWSGKKKDCKEAKTQLGALRECANFRGCKIDSADYVEAVKDTLEACPPPPPPKPKTTST